MRSLPRVRLLMLLPGLVFAGVGCAPHLPRHAWIDSTTAMRIMHRRAAGIRSISARCRLVLTGPDQATMQFDGALAVRMPDHFRLRAWKFSRPAFDVTLTPEGLWRYVAKESDDQATLFDDLDAARLKEAWSLVIGEVNDGSWMSDEELPGQTFRLRRIAGPEGSTIVCEVDRDTLTIRECTPAGAGKGQLALIFDRYRRIGRNVLPTRIEWKSERGSMAVWLNDIELNGDLPEAAFIPPGRAVKQP